MRAEAWTAIRLALRHHPLCDRFDADRFGPICSGCAVFWPAFFVAGPAAASLWLQGTSAWVLLAVGVVVGLPQLPGLRWRFSRPTRAVIKGLGGLAVGAALFAVIVLPVSWWLRGGLLACMGLAFVAILAIRMRSILATCNACVWKRDWGRCPGFGALDATAANQSLTWTEPSS